MLRAQIDVVAVTIDKIQFEDPYRIEIKQSMRFFPRVSWQLLLFAVAEYAWQGEDFRAVLVGLSDPLSPSNDSINRRQSVAGYPRWTNLSIVFRRLRRRC